MTVRNPTTELNRDSVTVSGVDTDASGNVVITIDGIRDVESAADAYAYADGGFVANVQSVDGADVTVRLFEGDGTAGPLVAVTDGTGVTDVSVAAEGQSRGIEDGE